VNVGNSTGSSGLDTNLAPSMTLGTGFVGRSGLGENLQPHNLMNWTRIAYPSDAGANMPNFAGITPWRAPAGQVPAYPRASNDRDLPTEPQPRRNGRPSEPSLDALRAELRQLVVEELAQLIKR
jgi:hypothetical protein